MLGFNWTTLLVSLAWGYTVYIYICFLTYCGRADGGFEIPHSGESSQNPTKTRCPVVTTHGSDPLMKARKKTTVPDPGWTGRLDLFQKVQFKPEMMPWLYTIYI